MPSRPPDAAPVDRCGALPLIGRHQCDLPKDHDGAHMAFQPNGTHAWGHPTHFYGDSDG